MSFYCRVLREMNKVKLNEDMYLQSLLRQQNELESIRSVGILFYENWSAIHLFKLTFQSLHFVLVSAHKVNEICFAFSFSEN